MRSVLSACALAGLAACAGMPSMHPVSRAAPEPAIAPARAPHAPSQEPVLYGRDGKPVGEPVRGASAPADAATPGGRMTLLELYQKALERRDALEREVEVLRAQDEKVRAELASLRAENERLKQQGAGTDSERDKLIAENAELAARLSTAHMRRMEAEKELLELKLERLREKAAAATAPAKTPPKGEKP